MLSLLWSSSRHFVKSNMEDGCWQAKSAMFKRICIKLICEFGFASSSNALNYFWMQLKLYRWHKSREEQLSLLIRQLCRRQSHGYFHHPIFTIFKKFGNKGHHISNIKVKRYIFSDSWKNHYPSNMDNVLNILRRV